MKDITNDFQIKFDSQLPYLRRHFSGPIGWLMLKFFKKDCYNLMFDCADIGWGIRKEQEGEGFF